ncbi:MAG: NMD3-related protein [Candidatus Odinarchaeia archaeon]
MDWICANCGKKIFDRSKIRKGLCLDCYKKIEQPGLTLTELKVNICPICFSYKIKDKWVRPKNNDFEAVLKEAIPVYFERVIITKKTNLEGKVIPHTDAIIQKSKSVFSVPVTIIIEKQQSEGKTELNQFDSEIKINLIVCDNCTKVNRGSYEAVIQIRAKKRKISDGEKKDILNFIDTQLDKTILVDRRRVITKIKENKSGLDIYIVSSKIAKILATGIVNNFGCILKESKKLAGRNKSGKTIYRTAYSLRLPIFRINDIIQDNDRYYLIIGFSKGRVSVLDVSTNTRSMLPLAEAWKTEEIIPREYFSKFIVVAVESDIVDLLNLDNYRTVIVNKPVWKLTEGQEVEGFITDEDKVIIIPRKEQEITQ